MVKRKFTIRFETMIKGSKVGTITLNHRRIPLSAPCKDAFGKRSRISRRVIVHTDNRSFMLNGFGFVFILFLSGAFEVERT